ncbi:ectoine/hydroxyectoine ABC transporter permease subunit EhuD [Planosporangium flavigriseum]|uniref:Ectoine/hydroxyectoine ABC transporter permease subunit EhuD n=1 Tax=Planosporangium flavigriseum TaxID=373681 RepID=A0A8J3PK79_9ACTN|nr:ectoine/hydroxyectoine ABC transporter permease subunit EhuD [Planosporangium flavigriseum]NJC63047.1 ectoine/hydroxyectoine ABC transporter permease subunit EhuD [Planosporangium flavigriseum]GIG73081.1 ectoine/hydroxyectoine ABC transporter permease subunit EhuD [Planosporangium flavigriseum]
MTWDNEFAMSVLPELLQGLVVTVKLTLCGISIALIVGLIAAVLRFQKIPVLAPVLGFYVQFMRGTPLLIQAYVAFFVLPQYGITLSPFVTGVIVIGLNYSAYTAEVYRAGIEGVPTGQWEAVAALGLGARRKWLRIILPQAVRTMVPVLGNYFLQMFKDSAILSAITVVELLAAAMKVGGNSFRYLEPLTLAGLLFMIISFPASLLIRRLERRFATTH